MAHYIIYCGTGLLIEPCHVEGVEWRKGDVAIIVSAVGGRAKKMIYDGQGAGFAWHREFPVTDEDVAAIGALLQILDELGATVGMSWTLEGEARGSVLGDVMFNVFEEQPLTYYGGEWLSDRRQSRVRILKLTEDDWKVIDLEFELKGMKPYRR